MNQAAQDVLAERERQKTEEAWTEDHDDAHTHGELAVAASCYAYNPTGAQLPSNWPWGEAWWKYGDRRRNCVKAAALLLAEIERIDRGESK